MALRKSPRVLVGTTVIGAKKITITPQATENLPSKRTMTRGDERGGDIKKPRPANISHLGTPTLHALLPICK
jgi:hypothetical protein